MRKMAMVFSEILLEKYFTLFKKYLTGVAWPALHTSIIYVAGNWLLGAIRWIMLIVFKHPYQMIEVLGLV